MSPLRPWELFAAKVVPVVALVPLAALGSVFGIVHGVFGTPIRGSVALFYVVSVIYVFALASLGPGRRDARPQSRPGDAAPAPDPVPDDAALGRLHLRPRAWGRSCGTRASCPRCGHYVDFGYQVLFKGNGLAYVWPDVVGILAAGRAAVRDFHPALRAARALTRPGGRRPTGAAPPHLWPARPSRTWERRGKFLK